MLRKHVLSLAVAAIFAGYASAASATLLGDSITANFLAPDTSSVTESLGTKTISPTASFSDGVTTADVSATTIQFSWSEEVNFSPVPFNGPEFIDNTNSDITNVTIGSVNIPGFFDGLVSFTGNTVLVNLEDLLVSTPSHLTLDVATGPTSVPEPFTLSLFGAGLIGAAAMRRRKAKR